MKAIRIYIPSILGVCAMLACNAPGLAPAASAQPVPTQTPLIVILTQPPATAFQTPTFSYTPLYEQTECLFSRPTGYVVECGWLTVPEDRSEAEGRTIRLHVARFKSTNPSPAADPVVFLSGGPGSSALRLAAYTLNSGMAGVLAERDLLLFDQRGVGFSDPALNCPERERLATALLTQPFTLQEANALEIEAYRICGARLREQGIDLAAYHSAASAADIADLQRTLGYDQINLYGVSYGTRLALTVMRSYPEGLRSVVLDSVYPPQRDLYTEWPTNAERAFDTLFAACAVSTDCANRYPDLEARFYALVDRLNAAPVTVPTADYAGTVHNIRLDGNLLIDVIFVGMYRFDVLERLPSLIVEAEAGNYGGFLADRLRLYFDFSSTPGMQAAVQCNEEIPFSSVDDLLARSAAVEPRIAANYAIELQSLYGICNAWALPNPPAIENEAVTSSIPTLILAGRFDPITPPAWGQIAGETLPQSYYYEFPSAGHWIGRSSQCAMDLTVAFLRAPDKAPNAGCLVGLPGPSFR